MRIRSGSLLEPNCGWATLMTSAPCRHLSISSPPRRLSATWWPAWASGSVHTPRRAGWRDRTASRSGRTWSRSVMRTTRRSCVAWFTVTWPLRDRRCRAQTRPQWKTSTTCAKTSQSFAMRWGTCWASGPPNMPCSTQGAKKTELDILSLSPFPFDKTSASRFIWDAVWPEHVEIKTLLFESQRQLLNLELN